MNQPRRVHSSSLQFDTALAPEDVFIPTRIEDLPPLPHWQPASSPARKRPFPHIASAAVYSTALATSKVQLQAQGYPGLTASLDLENPGPTTRPLRVAHVGPNLVRGGAEQWLIELTRFLDPQSVQIVRTIATRPMAIDPDYVSHMRVPVEIGQSESVRRAAQDCDILLSWGVSLNDWLIDCRPKLCVVVVHGDGAWNREYLDGCSEIVDHVVAVSHAVKVRNCTGYPTSVIYNGVDTARLAHTQSRDEMRASLGFGPRDFVLGYLGRFSPEKRAHILIEAVASLPAHFKLLLVGWGVEQDALLELANRRIPGRFAFATRWDYLGDYYQAMDAFCMASATEGLPLALLEAMMCGVPLIVTPVGVVPEILRDRMNALVVSGDPASIAQAARLFERAPAWAKGLATEAKSFAERYGHARRMARDYENLLHGLWTTKYGAVSAQV